MALTLKQQLDPMTERWGELGYDLGYGAGISLGYATLGLIGFEGRQEYGPLGNVVNLASRLCEKAAAGEVLMDQRTYQKVSSSVAAEAMEPVTVKGFPQLISVV